MDIPTYYSDNITYWPSVLELAFANRPLLQLSPRWDNNLPPTGWDHTVQLITLHLENMTLSTPAPNWDDIDWENIGPLVKELWFPRAPPGPSHIEE